MTEKRKETPRPVRQEEPNGCFKTWRVPPKSLKGLVEDAIADRMRLDTCVRHPGEPEKHQALLHLAVENDSLECIELLLQAGATLDVMDNDRETPLHYAARMGHRDAAALLLERGANPLAVDAIGHFPLERVPDGNAATMDLLLRASGQADPKNMTASRLLNRAVSQGNVPLVRHLTDAGADVEARDGPGRLTPLHWAVKAGQTDVVAFLLERGADVDAADAYRATPLHHAVAFAPGQAEGVASMLLAGGSDIEAREGGGKTPLQCAAISAMQREGRGEDDYAVVRLLLDAGANVNATDSGRWTVLHHVAASDHPELVALLISRGALVVMPDRFGKRPLDWFSYRRRHVTERHRETARLLIAESGGVSATDGIGRTLLHRAAMHANAELARLLLQEGADVNAQDGQGLTALALAAKHQHREVVEVLMAANADVNLGSPTAIEIAKEQADDSIIDVLRPDEDERKESTPASPAAGRGATSGGEEDVAMSERVTCRSCGYAGDIDRFPDTLSVYSDIRCPQCRSTDNQWNDDYRERLHRATRRTGERKHKE